MREPLVRELTCSCIWQQNRSRGRRGERPLTPTWRNSLDSLFTRKGSLILLDGNNAVEIYKVTQQIQDLHVDSHHSFDKYQVNKISLFCWNSLLYSGQTNKSSQPGIRGRLSDLYLPAITGTMSNLQAARAKLSHSCPYLSTSRRRGSTSSINSQRAPDFKQVSRLWLCWEIWHSSFVISDELYPDGPSISLFALEKKNVSGHLHHSNC